MTEYRKHNIASIIQPPAGEVVVNRDDIRRSLREKNMGFVAMGFTDSIQRDLTPDKNGIAYVDLNKSGRMTLEDSEVGVIATSSLAGCTGVAGFARRKDGTVATFISHYDPMSQHFGLTNQDTPVNKDLCAFRYQAQKKDVELDTPIYYLVAYNATEHHNPEYGRNRGNFKSWHYLDQINTTATQLGGEARVLLLPYNLNKEGHTLASGRVGAEEGIFWDGVKVDFDIYLASKDTPITT